MLTTLLELFTLCNGPVEPCRIGGVVTNPFSCFWQRGSSFPDIAFTKCYISSISLNQLIHRAGHRIPNLLSSLFGLKGVLLHLYFITSGFLGVPCNISTWCGWYVSQKCSSLPLFATKSEGSEFGAPPSVYGKKEDCPFKADQCCEPSSFACLFRSHTWLFL